VVEKWQLGNQRGDEASFGKGKHRFDVLGQIYERWHGGFNWKRY
jgi:hypothetical protein